MDKPSVYIETSIVSYLAADPSRHPVTLRNQQLTHAWWNTRRDEYELFTSDYVIDEVTQGDIAMARRRLALLDGIPFLAWSTAVDDLARALRREVPLPKQAETDAFHIAFATVHAMSYLLTWDSRHIANARLRSRIERSCMVRGYRSPRLYTPLEITGG